MKVHGKCTNYACIKSGELFLFCTINKSTMIGLRESAQGLLRGSAQTAKRCETRQVSGFCSRQLWTLLEYPSSPYVTKSQPGHNVTTSFLKCCTGVRFPASRFLSFHNSLYLSGHNAYDVSQIQRFLTSNISFKGLHQEGRENLKLNGDTTESWFESRDGLKEDVHTSSDRALEEDEYLSVEQWKALKDEWINNTRQPKDLFETRTMGRLCKHLLLQKGRSLLEFVRQEGIPQTYPLMGAYLYLCVRQDDHKELFDIYDWFIANNPVLESGVLTNLITGFCQTSRWRESLKFLEDTKQFGNPSARNYHSLITAACDHSDLDLVEHLLQDMDSHNIVPSEKTWVKLLEVFHCETTDLAVFNRNAKIIDNLLWYLRGKRSYPSVVVGSELQKWFNRKNGEEWKTSITRIKKNGKCRSCHSEIESLDISEEDFLKLRHQIIEKVIKGGDVYKKTRPDELKAFMKFVQGGAPYDVIVDGLNVSHINRTKFPSKLLRQFVVYLSQECRLKCLVLGRQHMLRPSQIWNQHHMEVIQDVADCFFIENVSEDDPFMLYATLLSGPKACYVSRDMLRDHKALLDAQTHVSFIKWQRGHQMYPLVFTEGKALFKPRIVHDTVIQYSNSTWHIPCDDGSPRYSYQVPLDWLCAKRVK
ncbi:mitochondrial ribonuclease P catalytic subunit-like isoform X1 [Asterias amurensis]|uniref:mitochondrial ribonuclease P catalytic subunit-like isoform X1 n=2 Tax=Asterias amurensis TaxID=7602 RepID=UPI003AB221A1